MDHITYDTETAHVLWSTIFSGTVERADVRTGVSLFPLISLTSGKPSETGLGIEKRPPYTVCYRQLDAAQRKPPEDPEWRCCQNECPA